MGFLAPWFLGGLLALGIPVFVHLLKRHITTPRPVGSLMFFERGTQSSTKHRRLKYLLLFALRFALVLLIVLAFADPFIRRSAADVNGKLLLIVLDNSFSMRAGTRFADAKQQAIATLTAKGTSQKAQLMVLGGQLAILTQPTADATQLRDALDSIEPGDGHANFGELGRGIRTLGDTVHGPIDLHLFSDMQKSAMPANFADMVLPGNATLSIHNVAKGQAPPNWTIESIEAPAELADPKDPKRSHVKAVVAGYNSPAAEKAVSLAVNGKVIATRKVNVPANGRATVEFAPLELNYGFNRCEVRLDMGDAFSADDTSVFAVRRSDPEKVLFVHASNDSRSPLYYGAALSAAAQASFVLQPTTPEQATDLDPARFAFVVLSDAENLPSLFERSLAQYVAKGGSVFIALGTNVGRHGRIPLWGGAVREVHDYARTNNVATMSQVDFTNPAMQESQPGRDNGGWAETKFYYAVETEPGQGASPSVIAKLSDGTPLLLEKQIGEGRVLLFTSGLDNITNDIPLHPVFVAFVDRIAHYLSGAEKLSGSRLVDSFVQLRSTVEAVGSSASVEVVDPAGRRPLSLTEARTAQTFRLDHAGFYQIRFANGKDAVIGVNPDRRESNLEPMPADIQQLWSGNAGSAETQPAPNAALEKPQMQRVSLWWYVMLLALIAMLAETALASRYMGTQREEA